MTNCQACSRKSDLWLCGTCQSKLRGELEALPWWLARLAEAAVGQVKLGDGGRGSTRREPFKGDDEVLALCACRHPEHEERHCEAIDREVIEPEPGAEDDGIEIRLTACMCVEYRPVANQAKIRTQFLAAGRVNARASMLMDEINNVLSTTIREMCESRGVEVPALLPSRMALWLAGSITAVASSDGAGQTFSELCGLTGRIERIINRPIPPRFVGPCPSNVDYGHQNDCKQNHPHVCGNRLMAKRDAIEVTCRACKNTHNVELLIKRLLADVDHWRFTREELIGHRDGDWAGIMGVLEEPVSKSTFHRWCTAGPNGRPLLAIAGYRRIDGSNVISRHGDDDTPIYRLSKVRRLRTEMGDKRHAAMGWR